MRLFVAVHVPDALKAKIASLSAQLKSDAIVPVRPENMHLTLRFIGEADDAGPMMEKLKAIKFKPFACSLKGVGVFPDENYIRVVWAGVESGGALEGLAKDVIGSLEGFGKEEERGFTAHLTIARVRRKVDMSGFLNAHKEDVFGGFEVSSFDLMESVLGGAGGPVYKRVATFKASG